MTEPSRDQLYAAPLARVADFAFDAQVAAVFPDMLQRSIPGYASIIAAIGLLAQEHFSAASNGYRSRLLTRRCGAGDARQLPPRRLSDLRHRQGARHDQACRAQVAPPVAGTVNVPIEVQCADVCEVTIERASMVVLNFTLQFIEPAVRLALLTKSTPACSRGAFCCYRKKSPSPTPIYSSADDHAPPL